MSDPAIAATIRHAVRHSFNPAQVPQNYMQQLEQSAEWPAMRDYLRQFAMSNRARYEAQPPCRPPPGSGATVTQNTGREATVKTGDKTLSFQKGDQRFSITDGDGKTVSVWGDPHYVGADGQTVDIHGDSVTTLDDGTRVFLKTSNAAGERETNPNAATYTKSVGIVRPDGTTIFVDNVTGDKPLEVSTPPYGQLPLDYINEKMGGDFKPEAYLAVNGEGQWTDLNGLPLTQQSANQMRDTSRSQRAAAASLASGCFENGIYPRSLWNSQGFDPKMRNSDWYGGLRQTQNLFEQAMGGQGMSQIAMMGGRGNVLMQICGSGFGGTQGGGNEYGSSLPMLNAPALLASMMMAAGQGSQPPMSPGYAASVMADQVGGGAINLDGMRKLASESQDPRVKASADFFVKDYDRRGTQSFWSQIETRDVRGFDNLSAGSNFRRFADDAGYAGEHPLETPYEPPMPAGELESMVSQMLAAAQQTAYRRSAHEMSTMGLGAMRHALRAY